MRITTVYLSGPFSEPFSGQVAATTHVGFQVISLWGVETKVKSVLQRRHTILFVVSVTCLQGEEHLHLVYDLDN